MLEQKSEHNNNEKAGRTFKNKTCMNKRCMHRGNCSTQLNKESTSSKGAVLAEVIAHLWQARMTIKKTKNKNI
jgi:hypothetical protein